MLHLQLPAEGGVLSSGSGDLVKLPWSVVEVNEIVEPSDSSEGVDGYAVHMQQLRLKSGNADQFPGAGEFRLVMIAP